MIITDEDLVLYRDEIFLKHDNNTLLNEIRTFKHSGKSLVKNLTHFFKEIRYTALYYKSFETNKSPFDILHDKEEVQKIVDSINKKLEEQDGKSNFYRDVNKISGSIDKYLNFNKGVTGQFDPMFIKFITDYAKDYYDDYFTKFHVHDMSCGWGCRMIANIALGNHYYGTDPNTKLYEKLKYAKDYYIEHLNKNLITDLFCLGSEIYIPEWENKMDYSFSSPPYYNMEMYSLESTQSVNSRNTGRKGYNNWLENFAKPSIDNMHKYVKHGGFVAINIKNYNKYNLYDDWLKLFNDHGGYELHDEVNANWKNKVKNYLQDSDSKYNEKIMIFKVVK